MFDDLCQEYDSYSIIYQNKFNFSQYYIKYFKIEFSFYVIKQLNSSLFS